MTFLGEGFRNLEHEQDRQTDTQTGVTECSTKPHSRMVKRSGLYLYLIMARLRHGKF